MSSRKRKNEEETFASSDLLLNSKIQVMLDKLSSCCSKCSNGFGCLLSLFWPPSSTSSSIPTDESFSTEYIDCRNQAVQYIKRCRLYGKVSNPLLSDRENRDNFLQEIFRGCIVDEQRLSTGQIKFSMKYCIPSTSDRLLLLHCSYSILWSLLLYCCCCYYCSISFLLFLQLKQ